MFELFRNQSRSASGAIKYVTVGVLMMIWAGLWYYYFITADSPTWQRFACVGTILSGLAVGLIGLMFGLIGRGAKAADTTVGVASTPAVVPAVPATSAVSIAQPPVEPGQTTNPPVKVAAPATTSSVKTSLR